MAEQNAREAQEERNRLARERIEQETAEEQRKQIVYKDVLARRAKLAEQRALMKAQIEEAEAQAADERRTRSVKVWNERVQAINRAYNYLVNAEGSATICMQQTKEKFESMHSSATTDEINGALADWVCTMEAADLRAALTEFNAVYGSALTLLRLAHKHTDSQNRLEPPTIKDLETVYTRAKNTLKVLEARQKWYIERKNRPQLH